MGSGKLGRLVPIRTAGPKENKIVVIYNRGVKREILKIIPIWMIGHRVEY